MYKHDRPVYKNKELTLKKCNINETFWFKTVYLFVKTYKNLERSKHGKFLNKHHIHNLVKTTSSVFYLTDSDS